MIWSPATGAAIAPEEWATHHTFFPAGIGVIEYLVNLDRLGRDRVRFVALPLNLEGGDGARARDRDSRLTRTRLLADARAGPDGKEHAS